MRLIDADYYCDSICISNRNNCNKNLCPLHLAPTVDAALERRTAGKMNLIDKYALVEKLTSYEWNGKVSIEVLDMIWGFPPAPIVRCGECKYYGGAPLNTMCTRASMNFTMREDDFCSCGEKWK